MRIVQYIALLIAVLTWGVQELSAQEAPERTYSDNNPLIFEDAWDYGPFAFTDDVGDPKGYNVDIVKLMLERLDIPYVIRLKHFEQVKQDIKEGRADLTCAIKANYNNEIGFYGNAVLAQLTYSVLSPKKQDVAIRTLNDLRNHTAYVHSNDFLYHLMCQNALEKNALPYGDMKDLCCNVNKIDSGNVIYGTQPLRWLINKYHLDNVRLTPMNIPHAEYHFMSGDTVLLARLDSLYETMAANDEFKDIQDYWFRHDSKSKKEQFFSDSLLNMPLFVTVLILGTVLVIYYRIRLININQMSNKAKQMFSLYMESSRISLWIYDIENDVFRILDLTGEMTATVYTPAMFSMFYNADDFVLLLKRIDDVIHGQQKNEKLQVRYHMPSDTRNELYFDVDVVMLTEKGGMPTQLLGVQHDVTEETLNKRHATYTHTRFKTLFNSLIMDVFHFDKDRTLININDHALETFEICDKDLVLKEKYNIGDVAVCSPDAEYVCTITDCAEVNRANTEKAHFLPNRTMYYESISLPLYNIEGEYEGQFAIGREQTGIVESLCHIHEQIVKLYSLTSTLNQLRVSVNKALQESNAYQAKYDVASRCLTFERGGRVVVMTEMDCIFTLHTEWRDMMLRILKQMDRGTNKTFKGQFCTLLRDINNNPIYYSFDAIPMFDADGKVAYYYCLLRDRTERVAVDKRLAAETAKAQETERLQNFFIRNMNYEIRTPLNSIKGFAEMLVSNNAPEEEQVFVNEVKNNTHNLLLLVDDILLLSRLEANIQEFNYESIDVVGIFNAQCQMGWDTLLQPGVRGIVECNYEMLYGAVDVSNIGLLFSNLCTLSALYTYRGYIKATLDYHHDKLLVTITDTGRGFDKQMANTMFTAEHDSTTGDYKTELKLMICKQLVEKFGGQFDIDSELGKGSTVWFSIPFKAEHAIRKDEMEIPENGSQQVGGDTMLASCDAALLAGDIDIDSLSAEDAARLLAGSDMLKLDNDNDGGGGSFLDSLGF